MEKNLKGSFDAFFRHYLSFLLKSCNFAEIEEFVTNLHNWYKL